MRFVFLFSLKYSFLPDFKYFYLKSDYFFSLVRKQIIIFCIQLFFVWALLIKKYIPKHMNTQRTYLWKDNMPVYSLFFILSFIPGFRFFLAIVACWLVHISTYTNACCGYKRNLNLSARLWFCTYYIIRDCRPSPKNNAYHFLFSAVSTRICFCRPLHIWFNWVR